MEVIIDNYLNDPENITLLQKLLYDPETVDFVIRRSEFSESIIRNFEVAIAYVIGGRYAILYARQEVFNKLKLALGSGIISITPIILGLLDRVTLEAAGIIQVHNQPFLGLKGQGVIVGFVDTGIDYTLDVFRYENGESKIISIFDQTVEGPPPEGFYIGTEYTNEQINAALQSDNPLQIVPETDNDGHGTFLASVAAGRAIDDFLGAAPDAEIIAVKLRKARPAYLRLYSVPESQENAFESTAVMVGIEYILDRATKLNRPVVICLGLGSNFGSHDAYSIFEEYLSGIANLVGVCLCVAAGNESQARHHTEGLILAQAETQNIDIRVGNKDAGDIFLSIWTGVADRISVAIRSPTGEFVPRIPARSGVETATRLILENSNVGVSYFFPVEGTGGQLTAIKIINATPGIWTITLYGDLILNGTFHSWLPMTGFIHPSIEYLAPNPNYTVTVPATMLGAIVCGAYNSTQNSLYSNTSWGPTRTGQLAPDFVAPGFEISGFYPYGKGTMSGTSVATAITAGAAALMLEWGIIRGNDLAMSTYQIRAFLVRGCYRSETMQYPNNRWGYGSLNLLRSFELMREL